MVRNGKRTVFIYCSGFLVLLTTQSTVALQATSVHTHTELLSLKSYRQYSSFSPSGKHSHIDELVVLVLK